MPMPMHDDLIYLDGAATSFPKPPAVAQAVADHLAREAVNPGRAGFDLAVAAGRRLDALRADLGRFCGNPADDADRTILCANATDALNTVLAGVLRPGDHAVSTVMDHNSALRPLWMLRERAGVDFDLAPADGRGLVDPADVAALLRPETRLVVMTHASNVCGAVQPVAEVGRLCRERGVLFVLDAAQSAGRLPVDMATQMIDAVAVTGHKGLMGPTGTGALVLGPGVEVASTRWGGTGVRSAERAHLDSYPYRLEAGTPNASGLAGLAAGLAWVRSQGPANLLRHEQELVRRAADGCRAVPGVRLHGPWADPSCRDQAPTLSLTIDGREPDDVGALLDVDANIAVRTGLQCAPLAHEALGTAPLGTVRVSPGPFNSAADVDRLLDALAVIAG